MAKFEKFYALTDDKQDEIINAAMAVFGNNGFKKAYISEISEKAGISKSMIFYYFGSKEELYFFLLDISFDEVVKSFDNENLVEEKDFFKRIINVTELKMSVLRKRPSVMKFLTSYYFETDKEVVERKKEYEKKSDELRQDIAFDDLDMYKFKDTVDIKILFSMIMRWTEGYIAALQNSVVYKTDEEVNAFYDTLISEFYNTFEMLRINFYKPEYL